MPDILRIPVTPDEPSFKLTVDLEGRTYILRFDWNGRANRWFMGYYDAEEVPIAVGIPMNVDSSLLRIYVDERLPPGEMMLFDTSEQHKECGRDDLGVRCDLLYQTSL